MVNLTGLAEEAGLTESEAAARLEADHLKSSYVCAGCRLCLQDSIQVPDERGYVRLAEASSKDCIEDRCNALFQICDTVLFPIYGECFFCFLTLESWNLAGSRPGCTFDLTGFFLGQH